VCVCVCVCVCVYVYMHTHTLYDDCCAAGVCAHICPLAYLCVCVCVCVCVCFCVWRVFVGGVCLCVSIILTMCMCTLFPQVDMTIKDATNIDKLCEMYEGWTPWT
jgi:hypothetical protein